MKLVELARALEEIARAAGAVQMRHLGRLQAGDIDFKGRRDLITIADRESEELILSEIASRFPDHHVFAEESSTSPPASLDDDEAWTWIVDPLDGTTNFAHSHPFFAVSLGVLRGRRPVAGCVFAPRLDEMFIAVEGSPTTLNGTAVATSGTDHMMNAMLATGFAYRLEEHEDDNLGHFVHLVPRSRAVRRCGSAALDLAYVACGRIDGFWELHLSPWDVAGGAALVRCAGGRVTDFGGGEDWLLGDSIVATNGPLHDGLRAELLG